MRNRWAESTVGAGMVARGLGRFGRVADAPRAALGHGGIDAALGGGLLLGHVHEAVAAHAGDAGSAAGFAAMLARRLAAERKGMLLWLREDGAHRAGALYAPGLAAIGLDPARLVVGVLADAGAVLRAAVDVLRCPGVAAAVVELWGRAPALDLTASRRLTLAAEASGVTALVLRIAAMPAPSAAQTRWTVRAGPSAALEAGAPGLPRLDLTLARQRGGPSGLRWDVEWDRDAAAFRAPSPSGDLAALSAGGPLAAGDAAAGWGAGGRRAV
ncbi:MAG: hypothetical protein INF91_07600 [Alphaproteobacteria bacterium]|nr:hypothetical protein [Alphaproteobacteria bacterium]